MYWYNLQSMHTYCLFLCLLLTNTHTHTRTHTHTHIHSTAQMFALEFFRFNKEGLIKSEDAAYILAFAIMMLHTSLHNPSVKNRTTKKQWVSMNRGGCECVCVCVCVCVGEGE